MQLQHQHAMLKMAGALKKSTEIMRSVNQLMRIPECSRMMQQMAFEMTKAGVMEEIMQDTLEQLDEGEDEEQALDEQVEEILYQATNGKLGQLTSLPSNTPLVNEPDATEQIEEEMQARLEALRN